MTAIISPGDRILFQAHYNLNGATIGAQLPIIIIINKNNQDV